MNSVWSEQGSSRDHTTARRAGWFAILAVIALVFYWGSGREDATVPVVHIDTSWVDAAPRLSWADTTGAITSAENGLRGVKRDGTVAWVKAGAELGALSPVCSPSCPNTVFSGDGDDFAVDPAPLMEGQVEMPADWLQPTEGSNVILAATKESALRVTSNAAGETKIERRHQGASTSEGFTPGSTGWGFQTADARAGVLVSLGAASGGRTPMTFAWLTPQGWQLKATSAQRACISSDGTRRVEDDVLVKGTTSIALPKSLGPQCQFAASGVLFGNRGQESSTYTFVGNDGKVLWSRPAPPYSWWSASEVTDTVAYSTVTKTETHVDEVDRSGTIVRTIPGASSALHTSTGELVTVNREAKVTWHPRVN